METLARTLEGKKRNKGLLGWLPWRSGLLGLGLLGPLQLSQAAPGEVFAEELGETTVHFQISEVSDHFADDELHGLGIGRHLVKNLHMAGKQTANILSSFQGNYTGSLFDENELHSIAPTDHKQPFDIPFVIARIVDGSEIDEFKKPYGTTLVTGFAKIFGQPVGIVGNHDILFTESAVKGAQFI